MELTVIGCGDAFGNHGRNHTSFMIDGGDQRILLDCGATTLVRLKQLDIEIDSIGTIIISHFHGDHYGGLPFFLLSSKFEVNRQKPLNIIGPKGMKDQVFNLQNALYPGTGKVLDELPLSFLEFDNENGLAIDDLKITSRKVVHSPDSKPHGYLIEWKGKCFGYSGDTEWTDKLIDLAYDTDIFILECNNLHKESSGHLSYDTIKAHFEQLKTNQLFLTHMGNEVIEEPELGIKRLKDGDRIYF